MTSFNADSSQKREYRAHLTHQRDLFHAWMLKDLDFSRPWEMPRLKATHAHPKALVPFSVAMSRDWVDFDCFVHFYEDDFRFERIWNDPKKYLPKLAKFDGVIMPDFSTCIDFPRPLKLWNAYRNQLLGAWLQSEKLSVIPNARYQPDCDWLVEGLPRESVIAICGRGLTKNLDERRRFVRDVKATVEALAPAAIVYYGSEQFGVMDYPRKLGITVWSYPGAGRGKEKGGKSGQWS